MILNSNENFLYHKFKMDTLRLILALVKRNCYMATIDLQDAYYVLPVHPDHHPLLLAKDTAKIREVAAVIGKIVATFPAADYGPLFYWALERGKSNAVKC